MLHYGYVCDYFYKATGCTTCTDARSNVNLDKQSKHWTILVQVLMSTSRRIQMELSGVDAGVLAQILAIPAGSREQFCVSPRLHISRS